MPTQIQLKRGTGTPASLATGEPAVDLTNHNLHLGNAGQVQSYPLGCQNYAMPRSRFLVMPGVICRGATLFTTGSVSSSIINFWPVVFPRLVTPVKTVLDVTTAGSAGSRIRVGIYKNDFDSTFGDVPTTKLAETGLFITDSTGYKEQDLLFTFQPGVLYWFAIYASGAPTIRCAHISAAMQFGRTQSGGTTAVCMRRALYSNANVDLPATAPSLEQATAGNDASLIFLVHLSEMPSYV
jgi:hypothetical protein